MNIYCCYCSESDIKHKLHVYMLCFFLSLISCDVVEQDVVAAEEHSVVGAYCASLHLNYACTVMEKTHTPTSLKATR